LNNIEYINRVKNLSQKYKSIDTCKVKIVSCDNI
jgi:hypothetical protein